MRRFLSLLTLAALLLFLHTQFPDALRDESSRMQALYLVLLIGLGFGGSRAIRGRAMPAMLRDAAIWLVLLVLLVVAYSFRDEFGHSRLMAELLPSRVQVSGDGTVIIHASEGGHFLADAYVNGVSVRFLIDTGASDIVLAPEDARRIGFSPEELSYMRLAMTANGTVASAGVTLDSLKVGSITLTHVPASVNKVPMRESLLGMSFLRRLSGFRVENDRLMLMP